MPVEKRSITSVDEWLEWRKQHVTASDVACLFNLHPYRTVAQLYAEKTGIALPAAAESSAMYRGKVLEAVVGSEVGKARPEWAVSKATDYFFDPVERIGATPDFFVDNARGRGVLQTKTVAASVFKHAWGEQVPFWIALQATTEAMLSGADFSVVAALEIGDFAFNLHVFEVVERHAAAERRIRDAVAAFWDRVRSGTPPSLDFERDAGLIAALFPRETPGKVVDLHGDNHIRELLEERESLRAAISAADERCDAAEAEIKAKLGDAETALVPGWRVSWRLQHRKAYQVRETTFRKLSITRERETGS